MYVALGNEFQLNNDDYNFNQVQDTIILTRQNEKRREKQIK